MSASIKTMKVYQPSNENQQKSAVNKKPYVSNCHYQIVVHDCAKTKGSFVPEPIYTLEKNGRTVPEFLPICTDKRNALQYMETYAYRTILAEDGVEHLAHCLYKEKRFLRKTGKGQLPKKHYITRNAEESPDSMTVWRKHDVKKHGKGYFYGRTTWTETVVEKLFTVSIVQINKSLLDRKSPGPNVVYKPQWCKDIYVNPGMTEEETLTEARIDIARAFSEWLRSTDAFKKIREACDARCNLPEFKYYIANKKIRNVDQYDDLQTCNIGLPKIRYECNLGLIGEDRRFLTCRSRGGNGAHVYVPPEIQPEPELPSVEEPVLDNDPKDNM